jgi:hypothetical protein
MALGGVHFRMSQALTGLRNGESSIGSRLVAASRQKSGGVRQILWNV